MFIGALRIADNFIANASTGCYKSTDIVFIGPNVIAEPTRGPPLATKPESSLETDEINTKGRCPSAGVDSKGL